jgi:hypothetical protein
MSIQLNQHVPPLTADEAHQTLTLGEVLDLVLVRYGVERNQLPEEFLLQLDAICQQAARAQAAEIAFAAPEWAIKLILERYGTDSLESYADSIYVWADECTEARGRTGQAGADTREDMA